MLTHSNSGKVFVAAATFSTPTCKIRLVAFRCKPCKGSSLEMYKKASSPTTLQSFMWEIKWTGLKRWYITNSIPIQIIQVPKPNQVQLWGHEGSKSAFPVPDTMLAGEGVKVMLTNKCPSWFLHGRHIQNLLQMPRLTIFRAVVATFGRTSAMCNEVFVAFPLLGFRWEGHRWRPVCNMGMDQGFLQTMRQFQHN